MALEKILCVLVVVCICNCRTIVALAGGEFQQDSELEHRLNLVNKPAIKTIKLDYGIFDCVDLYKQPAFDHPLLKNHKIQMKPTHFPDKVDEIGFLTSHSNEFGESIDCPIGSVPIRRTTKEDLIRQESLEPIHAYHPNGGKYPNIHFAVIEVQQNRPYQITGAKAIIGTFNPQTNPGEFSGAQVWISDNPDDGNVADGLSAGWMANHDIYGNSGSYFTASWKNKNGAGCYNVLCPGFVQVHSNIPLGSSVPLSSSSGTLVGMLIWIFQDRVTKNWWLVSGVSQKPIGYWPKELFSTLNDGAKTLTYGGIVKANPNQLSPPMGSGIFYKCRDTVDGFFASLSYQINDEVLKGDYILPRRQTTVPRSDCPNYRVGYMCRALKDWQFYFLYGGPRGYCG